MAQGLHNYKPITISKVGIVKFWKYLYNKQHKCTAVIIAKYCLDFLLRAM